MKTKPPLIKTIVYTLVIVFVFLGTYIASITYHHEFIVRGILGLAVMYLLFRVSWSSKEDSIEDYYPFSKNIRYFIFAFIGGIIFYWAAQQTIEMVLFYLKK
jgi:hypothetical protein